MEPVLQQCEEGNGNLLQYSLLENPRDGGAWWAAVYGVAQSRARLKRLSGGSSMESQMSQGSELTLLRARGAAGAWPG